MRTRERVLLATLAVAGLTVLASATASAATTTEAPTSAQPAHTFTLIPTGDAIRLAVHTTPLVDGTVPDETSSGMASVTSSDPVDNAADAPHDVPSQAQFTPAGVVELTIHRANTQVSAYFRILANGWFDRHTTARTEDTALRPKVFAAVGAPANRGGVSPANRGGAGLASLGGASPVNHRGAGTRVDVGFGNRGDVGATNHGGASPLNRGGAGIRVGSGNRAGVGPTNRGGVSPVNRGGVGPSGSAEFRTAPSGAVARR